MTTPAEIDAAMAALKPPFYVSTTVMKEALDAAETIRNEIVGKLDTPKTPGDRPEDGPFTREHFARLSKEWDDQRVLPDNAPTWNMDYFQWNGISAALKIAAEKD